MISPNSNINVKVDEDVSTLTIANISRAFSANSITCNAANQFGVDRYRVTINVSGDVSMIILNVDKLDEVSKFQKN